MLRLAAVLAAVWMGTLLTAPGASALELVPCASEDGFCRVPYPTRVIYGIPGRTTSQYVEGRGIPCSNDAFGDPAPGRVKRCSYVARGYERPDYGRPGRGPDWRDEGYGRPGRGYERPDYSEGNGTWRTCAREEGFCSFRGTKRVRYGARGRYFEGTFRNGVSCDNETFGDPVQGSVKSCQVFE